MRNLPSKKWFFFAGGFILFILMAISPIATSFNYLLHDSFIRWFTPAVNDNMILVVVDDASEKMLARPWPFGRKILADTIARIAGAKPKSIGVDFILSDPSDPSEDLYFEKTMQTLNKTPILFASYFYTQKQDLMQQGNRATFLESRLETPFFKSQYGFINTPLASDEVIRSCELFQEQSVFFSLALLTLENNSQLSHEKLKQTYPQSLYIRYRGPGGTFPQVSIYQAYQGLFEPQLFAGKTVIIGNALAKSSDLWKTPFPAKTNGSEILLNIYASLVYQDYIQASPLATILILLVLCALSLFVAVKSAGKKILVIFALCLLVLYLPLFTLFFYALKLGLDYFLLCALPLYLTASLWLVRKPATVPGHQVLELVLPDLFLSKYDISSREKEIIELILMEQDNNQIAKKLYISLSTVKKHVYNIFQKTKVSKKKELVARIKDFSHTTNQVGMDGTKKH